MSDSNIGGEASLLEERRRKLDELREQNIAYINNYIPAHKANELHDLYGHLSKEALEDKKIDPGINYNDIFSLSTEGKDKLIKIKPNTIGDATRISGVSSSDVSILLLYLSNRRKK